ncbi:MAG TPA: hypothetical protein VKQ32_19320 [Polyangia bacterium]|nr:hypothetical protein [Polyangia bacterium]
MAPNRMSRLWVLVGAFLMTASCASAPKPAATTPRDKNSAPEKVAAQRAGAAHELQLEQDDERWGIEAARERKRLQDEAKARQQPAQTGKNVDVLPPSKP